MMTKKERFAAASRGEKLDRPVVGCWVHFGSALWDPELVADVHLRFYRDYDWDFIKVMDDYRFPTADGVREAVTPDHLRAVGGNDLEYDNAARQLEVLRLIRAGAPDAPIVDTVFSPLQTVVRTLGDTAVPLLRANPEIAREVLGNVAGRLADFARASADLVDGVHFSVNGASADWHGWGLSGEEFTDWVAPFDRKVLEAYEGRVRIMHVHGYDLTPDLVDDYPVEVMSWSHNQTRPTVTEVSRAAKFVPMAGLDEIACIYWPPSKVAENVIRTRREADDRLIVAPGCTVHSDTPPAVLRALVEAARRPLD